MAWRLFGKVSVKRPIDMSEVMAMVRQVVAGLDEAPSLDAAERIAAWFTRGSAGI